MGDISKTVAKASQAKIIQNVLKVQQCPAHKEFRFQNYCHKMFRKFKIQFKWDLKSFLKNHFLEM